MLRLYKKQPGFTIVELLVVIVVIGVLAAITIVSYTGISSKAVASSLQSDLNNASTALKLFQVDNSNYPTTVSTNCQTNPTTTTNLCLKVSSGNTYPYYQVNNSTNPQIFSLLATNSNNASYRIADDSKPIIGNDSRTSCLDILNVGESSSNGIYWIKPAGTVFPVYCDMTTDGGGWTIVTSQTGLTTGQYGLVDDTEANGSPLSYQSYNLNLIKKENVSVAATESLIKRSTGVWIKANHALFDDNLVGAGNQHPHWQVTVTANNGATAANSQMGYSNYLNSNGGDYGITTSGAVFDHHNSTTYYHLNASCLNMYFYNYGSTYDVNTALGAWPLTNGCGADSLSMGGWYAATR